MTTTSRKATHAGSCQVCGHEQKLPNDKLSLHGYTTRFGFFEGTCSGSRELPFEVSIHLILDSIERARVRGEELKKDAAAVVANATPAEAWYHQYVPARRVGRSTIPSGYEWVRVALSMDETGVKFTTEKTTSTGCRKAEEVNVYRAGLGSHKTVESAALAMAQKRAEFLLGLAAQTVVYIKWQNERIAGWAPKPTKALVEIQAAKKVTARTRGARVTMYLGRNGKGEVVRVEGVVVGGSRDMTGAQTTIKLDDGSFRTARASWCSLVEAK